MKTAQSYRPTSNRRAIAVCAESGLSKEQTYAELKNRVTAQTLVFKSNPPKGSGLGRQPKPMQAQYVELMNEIGRVWKELGLSKGHRFEDKETRDDDSQDSDSQESDTQDSQEDSDDDSDDSESEEISDDDSDDSQESDDDSSTQEIRAKGKDKLREELLYFHSEVKRLRRVCWEKKRNTGATLDDISYRGCYAARWLIPAGIPADVLLLAMTMHWSPESRADAGVDSWDFYGEGLTSPHPGMLAVSMTAMKSRGIDPKGIHPVIGRPHPLFGYALLLAEARPHVPMMLIGPAGTGKSYLMKQVALYLELPYGEAPMSSGANRSDLLGRHTISKDKPFIPSENVERYVQGGMFNYEEIDRGDPSVMITMNNALASDEWFNPVNGERYDKSGNFLAGSTANTMGLGANRDFNTAEKLDPSTLDRFRMGRMFLPVDEDLEEDILFGRI